MLFNFLLRNCDTIFVIGNIPYSMLIPDIDSKKCACASTAAGATATTTTAASSAVPPARPTPAPRKNTPAAGNVMFLVQHGLYSSTHFIIASLGRKNLVCVISP